MRVSWESALAIPTPNEGDTMTANSFATDLRIDEAGQTDHLIVFGAGSADDPHSVRNDDDTAWDLWIGVEPSEERQPYDAALRGAGFEPVGDNLVLRA